MNMSRLQARIPQAKELAARIRREPFAFGICGVTLAAAGVILLAGGNLLANAQGSGNSAPRSSSEVAGSTVARDGETLQVTMDLGNVLVHTQDSGKVDYRVHLQTNAPPREAKSLFSRFHIQESQTRDEIRLRGQAGPERIGGGLWVTLELNIPQNMNLDVTTGGGNIQVDDIHGRVMLTTAGGNLVTGNVTGAAHLHTDGGHISVKNIGGELVAETGGGHITAGDVGGGAILHTNGGHIRVTSVEGAAKLETGGGNVTVEHAGADLVADTQGGQIDVGEAQGVVRAKTEGGGIRVVHVTGPTNLQTSNGSIYLTRVDSSVRAWTEAGGITAWIVQPTGTRSTCDLQSKDGDIVVYMPPELSATIDAEIQLGERHRLIVDPALPIKVNYGETTSGTRTVRAEGALNGGGEVFRLRTVAGNIRLIAIDSAKQLEMYRQQMEQLQQKLQIQIQQLQQVQRDDRQDDSRK